MKLTKEQLKRMIKEELGSAMFQGDKKINPSNLPDGDMGPVQPIINKYIELGRLIGPSIESIPAASKLYNEINLMLGQFADRLEGDTLSEEMNPEDEAQQVRDFVQNYMDKPLPVSAAPGRMPRAMDWAFFKNDFAKKFPHLAKKGDQELAKYMRQIGVIEDYLGETTKAVKK